MKAGERMDKKSFTDVFFLTSFKIKVSKYFGL